MATNNFALGCASLLMAWTLMVLDIMLTTVEKSCSMVLRATDAMMSGFVLYDATKQEFFAAARLLHGLMLRPWLRSSTVDTPQQASAAAPSLGRRLFNAAVMVWCVATVATVTAMRIACRVCVKAAATLLVRVPVIISLHLMLWCVAGVVALPWFAYNVTAGAYQRFVDRHSQVRRMATGAWCVACDCVRLAVLLALPVVWCCAAVCFSVYVTVQVLRGVPPSLQEASAVWDKLVPNWILSSTTSSQGPVATATTLEAQSTAANAALEVVESASTTTSTTTTISSSSYDNGNDSSSRPMGLKLLLHCSSGGVTRRVSSTQGLSDGGAAISGDGGVDGSKGLMVSSAPCTPTGTRSTIATPLKVLTSFEGGADVLLVSAPPSPTLPAVPRRRAFGSSTSSGSSSSSAASSSDAGSVGDDTSSAGSSVVVDSLQYGSGYVAALIAGYEASLVQRPAASAVAAIATAVAVVEVVSASPLEADATAPKAAGLAKRAFASLHAFVSVFE